MGVVSEVSNAEVDRERLAIGQVDEFAYRCVDHESIPDLSVRERFLAVEDRIIALEERDAVFIRNHIALIIFLNGIAVGITIPSVYGSSIGSHASVETHHAAGWRVVEVVAVKIREGNIRKPHFRMEETELDGGIYLRS